MAEFDLYPQSFGPPNYALIHCAVCGRRMTKCLTSGLYSCCGWVWRGDAVTGWEIVCRPGARSRIWLLMGSG